MRLLIKILLGLAVANVAFANPAPIRNDTPTTLRDLQTNLNVGANFAVDQYGQVRVGNITPGTAASSLGKAEDSPAASGDTGAMCLGVRQDSPSVTTSTDGDYSWLSTNSTGALHVAITNGFQNNSTTGLLKLEDAADASGNAGVAIQFVAQDPLSVDQNASGDYAFPKVDRSGRVITTLAPAGESWQSCGTATATTGDVAIKAAVASNRIYVTSITCKNTSATTATSLDFKDGTTVMAVGGISQMATTAPGAFTATFPVPLRGTSNTALNFATNVSVSSVTCCAAGYVATN